MIVKSGNMSLGVNLLAALTKRVAKTLDNSFDIEILEMHHNQKVDAPSGTALMLGRAAAEGRGIDLDQNSVRSRDGNTGARHAGDIGFANLRGGSVVGEHSVIFAGQAERIELVHKAEDRMIFARGALHAALWARAQKPGLYSMADVLGLAILRDFMTEQKIAPESRCSCCSAAVALSSPRTFRARLGIAVGLAVASAYLYGLGGRSR